MLCYEAKATRRERRLGIVPAGCMRQEGHPGFCTRTPDVAEREDAKALIFVQEHPISTLPQIARCSTCYALVMDSDMGSHIDHSHTTIEE